MCLVTLHQCLSYIRSVTKYGKVNEWRLDQKKKEITKSQAGVKAHMTTTNYFVSLERD